MDEYLWPARHVAEFAYCPRLFYLMEVEGVYYPSADTEKGKAVHQRVDKPSAADNGRAAESAGENAQSAAAAPDPDKPKSVRSLALTSQRVNGNAGPCGNQRPDGRARGIPQRPAAICHFSPTTG